MTNDFPAHFAQQYATHLKHLKRKGLQPKTIDAYARAIIMTVGIDLAKNVFAVHGIDENGKAALVKPKVPREQLLALIAHLPPGQGLQQGLQGQVLH